MNVSAAKMLPMTAFAWHARGLFLLASERRGNNGNTSTLAHRAAVRWLYTTGLRVWEFLVERKHRQREVRGETESMYICIHVRGGARIPPEPQLTQTQKNIAARQTCGAWIQLWHNFTGFSASILPEYRPLARSQKENWNSIISAQNNTSEIPVRALCTRPMHHAICLSAGQLFI